MMIVTMVMVQYRRMQMICDGEDNDCDELQDEHDAIDAFVWFVDEDDDGYGVPEDTIVAVNSLMDM